MNRWDSLAGWLYQRQSTPWQRVKQACQALSHAAGMGADWSPLRHASYWMRPLQELGVVEFDRTSILACQPIAPKVIAWFQPHGYAPTKFLRNDFVKEISNALRHADEIWMSEIFFAGGTTTKDISAIDLTDDIKESGANAFFIENRNEFLQAIRSHLNDNCVVLLMGARDPSLEDFAKKTWQDL